ncbi:erythromycin esterase family protein [Nostoc sp. FACHB-888]|uniref:erythromycin esterase family protein n=1 Tax=Nostoc sp. FACHB-888 TaxID=2692842 RepID=UPI0016891CFB|nr:erythromycin esterase family protein [Nostoc sp. FACHB-888]MBD2242124.1 erythromycin esterase family protein [Nostoc sp. FACHB-888]
MSDATATQLTDALHEAAHPLTGTAQDYDPLMDLIGNARFVLIGEASHGTHEFYEQRAEITKRLIQEKGFTAIAVEADWPDAYRVNRYVRGINDIPTPAEALVGFEDFPAWMWRNTDVVNFIGWLRQNNDALPQNGNKVGFYGLDLYSMYTSISEVIAYLDKVDPEAAQQARRRYSCLEHFEKDTKAYGYAAAFGMSESCEKEVINQLIELQRRITEYAGRDGQVAEDEFFYAQQNARLVKNAEEYYRSMFQGQVLSWNIRDRHMAETLDHLATHLDKQGNRSKIVVWAHNSHLGYVRATDMGIAGELNVGQLVRDKYGDDTVLVGFTTYTGTVTPASLWGGVPELKQVRPALSNSYEALFHEVGLPQFLLNLRQENQAVTGLEKPRLERAIGVIYQPETERQSHYFYARLPDQFDAVIHIDDSRGVQPLDRTSHLDTTDLPETFPFAV